MRGLKMDKPWFKNYPASCAREIDINTYQSMVAVFDNAVDLYSDKTLFRVLEKSLIILKSKNYLMILVLICKMN